jgi:SAM-dependent methyltransferase
MSRLQPFYDEDLAYIHDVGFSRYVEGCAPGVLQLFAAAGFHGRLIVDVGCGGGVWAKRLVDAGYQVVGLDIAPAMIKRARAKVPAAVFEVGSLWDHRLPRCHAVTAIGEVLCYRTSRQPRANLGSWLRRTFKALEPGGLLIFDVAEVGLDRNRPPTFAEGDDWACLVRFEYDVRHERLVRHITAYRKAGALFRRSEERHVLQLYRASQVASLLRASGFRTRVVRKFGSYPLLPGRVGFVARKP